MASGSEIVWRKRFDDRNSIGIGSVAMIYHQHDDKVVDEDLVDDSLVLVFPFFDLDGIV